MRTILISILLITCTVAYAGRDSYRCEIKTAQSLGKAGTVIPATGMVSVAIGNTLAVRRDRAG